MGAELGDGLNARGRIRRGGRNHGIEKLRVAKNGGRAWLRVEEDGGGRSLMRAHCQRAKREERGSGKKQAVRS